MVDYYGFSHFPFLPFFVSQFLHQECSCRKAHCNGDLLTIGLVQDMWTEKSNDDIYYDRMAKQEDFDKF